jgi:hypothetical protein
MSDAPREYPFYNELRRAVFSGSSRTIVLTGNVQDLFCLDQKGGKPAPATYVPLADFLSRRMDAATLVPVVYELGKPIRFVNDDDRKRFRDAWVRFQTGSTDDSDVKIARFMEPHRKAELDGIPAEFDRQLEEAAGNPAVALTTLQAMCACSRAVVKGQPVFVHEDGTRLQLVIIIEGADLLIPRGQADTMSDASLYRLAICRDWFSDIAFVEGQDTVILITESRSLLHDRVAKLPQLAEVAIPSPDEGERLAFVRWFEAQRAAAGKPVPKYWESAEALAKFTAALTLHALRQLLVDAAHDGRTLTSRDVIKQVEAFIQGQLGEGVVEFRKPEHTFDDLKGFRSEKAFVQAKVLRRLRTTKKHALTSIIVCGAIGAGKTYFWEAVAAMLGIPVLELKNLRSQWFGQTDVIFERLRRVLEALSKVLIYVNEADTAFGGVGADTHETERRLTGKLQAMMADPRLRGRVHWILDTARVHLLSPDLRRPGRGGDLIFAMFDPEGEDRSDFIRWTVEEVLDGQLDDETFRAIDAATKGYYAGAFSSLRAELLGEADGGKLAAAQVLAVVDDITPADIGPTRRYQTLQALLNCTRKSLRPVQYRSLKGEAWEKQIESWNIEAARLEAAGIH